MKKGKTTGLVDVSDGTGKENLPVEKVVKKQPARRRRRCSTASTDVGGEKASSKTSPSDDNLGYARKGGDDSDWKSEEGEPSMDQGDGDSDWDGSSTDE